ncbi:hypothetical protein DJ564_02940 [Pseudomonas sp. 31-12]|nr:hypothetical protein DJ564_02940 [Pseudomonas sp. 31-12]
MHPRSPCGSGHLWRGDLSPLGGEAAPKPATSVYQLHRVRWFTTASQSNGDKSPHHKSSLLQREGCVSYRSCT